MGDVERRERQEREKGGRRRTETREIGSGWEERQVGSRGR